MKHARSDYDEIQDPRGKIPEDEPVFLIRAQDTVGAMTVMQWADWASDRGADPKLVAAVREHARSMESWAREHGHKVPDAPSSALA